jgi:valyl-tRNA synthetase
MSTELAKTYDPAAVEAKAYQTWLDEKCFAGNPEAPGEPYSIVIPPPNVTGALHLGHAINATLQDILIRMHRMAGFNTVWIPGIDHAGIATQAVVEKQLKEQEGKDRYAVGREGLVARIWEWKKQYGDRILMQLARIGASCDWDRTRFTLDEMCAKAVRETFFKLFKDGLIYRGKRLVNWDIYLQTSISDDEIYKETVKTSMWHIRYPIEGGGMATENTESTENNTEQNSSFSSSSVSSVASVATSVRPSFMTVATTRPETMLGDTAVAVHSQDPRWNWAIGKFVRLPLTDRLIPIIADDILVDMAFGSGVVKVTPAHDQNDYAVWQRHQGKADQIEIINILQPDGRINENGGPYAGLKRDAARKKIVEDLTALGLLVKEEPHEAQVGHSDRSKTAVEPYLSDQWFVKMAPLAEPALEVVRNGTIKFYPERHAQQYLAWLGEKRDWPISRQLWWGHRIPIWSKPSTKRGTIPGTQRPMTAAEMEEARAENATDPDMIKHHLAVLRWRDEGRLVYKQHFEDGADDDDYPIDEFYCILDDNDREVIDSIENRGWKQDPDVLDTWFSSALWPHSTLGWPEATASLEKWYPTSVLVTGRDIITLWVARMVMTGMYNMGGEQANRGAGLRPVMGRADVEKSTASQSEDRPHGLEAHATGRGLGIPFRDVAINPTILDGRGERMSKSKGNGVDPVDIIDTHGADALRFTLATMATETQDARLPVKKDAQGRNTSDKFDLGRNFCNKLWNAARFAIANLENTAAEPVDEMKWSLADRWIVSRFNRAVEEADAAIKVYRFDVYAKACYDFFWRDFCDWYVEATKPAMKDPARAGQTANVLAAVLDGALRLMHPVIPFITETIWWKLCEVRAQRGLPGRIAGCTSRRLVLATWPTVGNFSEAAEHIFPKVQEIVGAIRNVRNEHKLDPKKPVTVSIVAGAEPTRQMTENREVIELLAICTLREIGPEVKPAENAARTSAAGCDVFVEGIIDAGADQERVGKRRDELIKSIAAMKGRLANEGYIAKAPPALVEQTKAQLAEMEAELGKIGA